MAHINSNALSSSGSVTSLKRRALDHLKENRYLLLLSLLCFTVSLIFSLNEFPSGSDIPASYIKIINMQNMLKEGKFVRWSPDWYSGYPMFGIYPPLAYIIAASLSLIVNNIPIVMKLLIIASFTSYPFLLYRLGRVLGRSSREATSIATLFSLTPLNIFFLFNGYFVLIISLTLIFIFLAEFFKYAQNKSKTSFLAATGILAVISLTYHRALYFTIFIILFYILVKLYRKQFREVASIVIITSIGAGIASFWLLPAATDILTLQSPELYQSLISGATYSGISFQAIAMLFIIPYCYLVYKRIKAEKIRDDRELALLIALIFFTVLALGSYSPLYNVIPFSSSLRVEITLLVVTLLTAVLASNLFDDKFIEGERTFRGIVLASLIFIMILSSVFFHPQITSGLNAISFKYSNRSVNDSLGNLVNNAYVEQQVFLGKSDEDFSKALYYISDSNLDGRVVFYSNRSQTVDMFYYYAILPTSGKSTPQGIAPEGEGDLKWNTYTKHIIWEANETLLKLAGVRWIISNYPLTLADKNPSKNFGQFRVYELDDVQMLNGAEGSVHFSVGEIWINLTQGSRNFTLAESFNPRWHAFDQDGREIKIDSTEYGFMRITSANSLNEAHLFYYDTTIDISGRIITIVCLALFAILVLLATFGSSKRLSRIEIW